MLSFLKNFSVILILLLLSSSEIFSQQIVSDSANSTKKNALYATGGFVPLYGVANLSYERSIFQNNGNLFNSFWIKASAGLWGAWAAGGPLYSVSISALTGANNNHFELSLGYALLYNKMGYNDDRNYLTPSNEEVNKSDYINTNLAGGVGYRYQKPEGGFIFRFGLSYPESLYLSVGYCF